VAAPAGPSHLRPGRRHRLWNEEDVPEWRRAEFDDLKHAELKTSRAWAIKEALRGFWAYVYPRAT
jgi:hypothetical protein